MKLFKSIIKCGVNGCGHSYVHFKENGKDKYICNNYRKNTNCSRRVVEEDSILFIVRSYFDREGIPFEETNECMKELIEVIYVDENGGIQINYFNCHNSLWSDDELII